MARERTVIKGIVLRESDSKESDKILTVLTGEMGRISVIAKGARSRRSKVSAAAQLLAYSEMVLSESHGWQYLAEASTIELFDGIRGDIELLSLGSYFAELVDYVTTDDTEAGELLSLLLNALYALGTLHRPPELVKAAFEMRLMAMIGFEPLVDSCCVCGEAAPAEPVLDLQGGTLLCRSCAGNGHIAPLTSGTLQALRHVLYGDAKRLYSFSLLENDLRCFDRTAERYVNAMLDRNFRTLDFYKSLKRFTETQQPTTNSINIVE